MTQMSKTKINWMKASNQNIQEQLQDIDNLSREWRYVHNHLKELIIDDPTQGVRTRSSLRDVCNDVVFVSHLEPKTTYEVEKDHNWIMAMKEELN